MPDELSRVTPQFSRGDGTSQTPGELRLRDDIEALLAQGPHDPTQPFRRSLRVEGIVGVSEAMANVLKQVALVAGLQVPVLLTGQPGTGKTQLARAIHDNGSCASGPFVELDCATLPSQEVVASERLPSEARSTAYRCIVEAVEAAHGGTLLLAEVGELPLRQQAQLLQLLQSGTYQPIGGARPLHAQVRVIAVTRFDLESAVASARFRADLHQRLSVFRVRLPALSERRTDIAALARHFCKAASAANGFPAPELSPGALRALEHAELLGNVRELAHRVAVAAIRAHAGGSATIECSHLFPAQERPDQAETLTFHEATRSFQRALLRETLEREVWNVTAAARALDLTRAHVYNLMATLGIRRPTAADEA